MSKDVSKRDKLTIYWMAGIKVLRGIFIKLTLKQSRGLLFVGKKSSISHRKSISVGKNVKFEDYSEVHGLSKNGLHFGDNVTIGSGSVVGAGTIITKDIPKQSVVYDKRDKVIKER